MSPWKLSQRHVFSGSAPRQHFLIRVKPSSGNLLPYHLFATLHISGSVCRLHSLEPQWKFSALNYLVHHANGALLEKPSHILLQDLPPRLLYNQPLALFLHFRLQHFFLLCQSHHLPRKTFQLCIQVGHLILYKSYFPYQQILAPLELVLLFL